ncbi:MAG: glucodextranase DOMON-like domain-containing protein, partial [Syntrophothermus sp.]
EYFDQGFRALLAKVYESLGAPVPAFVNVPIIPKKPVTADQNVNGLSSPTVDGTSAPGEWDQAALFTSGALASGDTLAYAFDEKNLYFRVTTGKPLPENGRIGFYLSVPRAANVYPYSLNAEGETPTLLGIAATHAIEWNGKDLQLYLAGKDGWSQGSATGEAAFSSGTLEASVPWSAFGDLQAGDDLRLVSVVMPSGDLLPASGPAQIVLPDLGTSNSILAVEDPQGDDHGPGSYTYPTDGVFAAQAFDIKSFSAGYDDKNLIFKISFYGPIPNPWGSPNNLAIQTLDVYVDKDPGAGTGARLLLPGRNAALEKGNGWEVAVWAEGWTPQVVAPDPQTLEPKQINGVDFKVIVDPATSTVTLRVPRSAFGEGDPSTWGYVAMVMGQEGYPSTGVWRVRDVTRSAEQWHFGGAPDDSNHTRIIDLVWSDATPTQEDMLSSYTGSTADVGGLSADDFAQIKLLTAK